MAKTIVFIHGLFVTKKSWDGWAEYYQTKGYKTLQIAWPEKDLPPAEQRRNVQNPRLAAMTLSDVLEHHRTIIRSLDEKPIVIGHSFGGLLTQLLTQDGLVAGGVAVHSAPPQGLLSYEWPFLRSSWPGLNPLIPASRNWLMSFEQFQYSFVNTMPLAEQQAAYAAHVVPESRRIFRGALSGAAKIDYQKPHTPLLFIAGSVDHIVPASLNRANVKRYQHAGSVTDYKEFAGRNHFTLAQPGWETVADYALDWLKGKNLIV